MPLHSCSASRAAVLLPLCYLLFSRLPAGPFNRTSTEKKGRGRRGGCSKREKRKKRERGERRPRDPVSAPCFYPQSCFLSPLSSSQGNKKREKKMPKKKRREEEGKKRHPHARGLPPPYPVLAFPWMYGGRGGGGERDMCEKRKICKKVGSFCSLPFLYRAASTKGERAIWRMEKGGKRKGKTLQLGEDHPHRPHLSQPTVQHEREEEKKRKKKNCGKENGDRGSSACPG